MFPSEKNLSRSDDRKFDRLADGELSESERRELLASLDDEPEGWRRCALAFLEAQAWRSGMGEMVPQARPSSVPARPLAKPKSFLTFKTAVAVAASFLLAFGLGRLIPRTPSQGISPIPTQETLVAGNSSHDAVGTHPDASSPLPSTKSTPWQLVQLRAPALTGQAEPLQLPAVERDRLDDEFLKAIPDPLPDDMVQAMRRAGYEVQTLRKLVPVQMKDGRRLVVPVDQVELKYNHPKAY